MFGRKPRLSPLAVRKQLLIAESEVNRVRLNQEWQTLAKEIGSVAERAQSFGKMAVLATSLLAGLVALRRNAAVPVGEKTSWLGKIIGGARMATTVWLAWRSHKAKSEKQ